MTPPGDENEKWGHMKPTDDQDTDMWGTQDTSWYRHMEKYDTHGDEDIIDKWGHHIMTPSGVDVYINQLQAYCNGVQNTCTRAY